MLSLSKPSQRPTSSVSATADVVGLLRECHGRVRRFLDIAERLARPPADSSERDIREAATALHRYFSQALPLHVRDEEETLAPRLKGCDKAVDAALGAMQEQHAAHQAVLQEFLTLIAALITEPVRLGTLQQELSAVTAELHAQLGAHLEAEECILFPAIARFCDANLQATMLDEIRQRRRI